jgi:hypothetical protein
MGVNGFRKWLENFNCSRLSKANTDAMHHVFLDMNGIIHSAYDRTDPTIAGTKLRLFAMLDRIYNRFPPQQTLNVIFDGPAPIAKLATQRDRRRKYPDVDARQGALSEGEITTGSTFLFEVEAEVEAHLRKRLASSTLVAVEVFVSGTRVPGEGETKISRRIMELASREASDADFRPYDVNDALCVIGNDSDLVLHCIAATPYHNLFVVHPVSFVMTCVGDLLLSWTRGNSAALSMVQLPSARVDFAFLTQLAGCDHYDGIDDDCWAAWRIYRGARCSARRAQSRLVQPVLIDPANKDGGYRLQINTGFLREVVCPPTRPKSSNKGGSKGGSMGGTVFQQARREFERQQKSRKQGNGDAGAALCQAALWSLGNSCFGCCQNYEYRWQGPHGNVHALRKAVSSLNLAKLQVPASTSVLPPLTPLQTYVAIMSKPKLLPVAIRAIVESDDALRRLPQYDSISSVLKAVEEVFARLRTQDLTKTEQQLMSFSFPRLHVRRTPGGAASTTSAVVDLVDPHIDNLTALDASRFVLFQYSLDRLVEGVRIIVPYEETHTVLKVSQTLAAKLMKTGGEMPVEADVEVDTAEEEPVSLEGVEDDDEAEVIE